jgi:hypothetical protein
MKSDQRIGDKEWNSFVKDLLKSLASSALPRRGDNIKAAQALGVHKSTIEQMKSQGKGSLVTWFKLAAYHGKLSPSEIRSFFKNYPTLLKGLGPISEVDSLFESVKKKYSTQELAAWLKLLTSKSEVEDLVGVNLRAALKSKKRGPKVE